MGNLMCSGFCQLWCQETGTRWTSSHYVPRTAAAALEFEPVPTPGLSMWKLGLSQQKKQTNPDVETPDICDKEARSNIEKETKENG